MLDDLRKGIEDESFDDDIPVEDEVAAVEAAVKKSESSRFLGMTPVERMLLSIMMFMVVVVLGLALLLATGRIAF